MEAEEFSALLINDRKKITSNQIYFRFEENFLKCYGGWSIGMTHDIQRFLVSQNNLGGKGP